MVNHQHVNIAIQSRRSLVVNVKDVQILKNVMGHQLLVNNANKSVPLIDRMRTKR